MSEPIYTSSVISLGDERVRRRGDGSSSGGGGDDDMEPRVAALEKNMDKVLAKLDELREGQHKAELAATKQDGDLKASLAEFGGKISTLTEASTGLRRDVDKLPDKFGVAGVLVFVITGLGAAALLIKNVWPLLSKAFAP